MINTEGTKVWAHRGASGYAPENTLEAFKKAEKMKADGVELDVQLTKDGELVVIHDETVDRVSGEKGFVKDYTLKELKRLNVSKHMPSYDKKTRIPTLDEVFDLLKNTEMTINIELKNGIVQYKNLEKRVLALVEEYDMLDRIWCSSFNHESIVRMKKLCPDMRCGLLFSDIIVNPAEYASELHVDALHPATYHMQDENYIDKAHGRGLRAHVWTVNEKHEMKALVKAEADAIINVGVSGPGVVKTALEKVRGKDFEVLCETIKKTAFKVTRVGQLVAKEASKRLGIPFGIVDLSLAPTPAIGDSVAGILEEIGLEYAGAPGTTAALALLNDQVKKGGVMASSYVGGLSGAFIPVSEDQGMIDAVKANALTIEKLEAMTCVCSVGLDMIAIPGDTKATTISGIIADECAIGMVNQKTTAVRVIPVIGKGVGETVEFGGLLGYAPIMPVNPYSCDAFVNRGGRIPAPIHSFKN